MRLSGVDIGNVSKIRIVPDKDKQITPVEVTMRVSTKYIYGLRRDSVTSLDTAGVREKPTSTSKARKPSAGPRKTEYAAHASASGLQPGGTGQPSTLQNLDALLKRADRILAFAESGKGSLGKLIYDPTLYNRFSAT